MATPRVFDRLLKAAGTLIKGCAVTIHPDVPPRIIDALREFGFSETQLRNVQPTSQVVTDLGIWGDDFSEFWEILSRIYGTDHLVPSECIPSEFAWQRTLKGWLPFVDLKNAVSVSPLSVSDLESIMLGLDSNA